MKVLFIAHDSLKGGSGRCLHEFILQLKKEDGVVPVVLVHNKNSLYDAFKKKGIETYCCRFGYTCSSSKSRWKFLFWKYIYRNFANFWTYFFLLLKIDFKSIDAIHSNSIIVDFGAFLHRRTGIPLIWHLREFADLDFNMMSFYESLPKYACENAEKIISVSNVVKNHFVNNGGDSNKIIRIYDGVVGKDFQNDRITNNGDLLKIVMCGRFSDEKGQKYAIQALQNMNPCNLESIQLDFYGAGKNESILKQEVQKLGLEKNIHFCGFSNHLNELLCKYDVGLVLSASEGFGRTTVEYMLSGLYVIGSNSGATPELLGDGKYGSLVPFANATAVAKELEKILSNKSLYKAKAENGRVFANENFCIENNYKKIIQIIKSVC